MNIHESITESLMDVSNALMKVDTFEVVKVTEILRSARTGYSYVWLAGNGGSAATASHFANDLVKQCGLRAVALPDLVPVITAYGNDEDWDQMFSKALQAYAGPQDVAVVFSCSGKSPNIIRLASDWDGTLIVFTGSNQDSELIQGSCPEAVVFVDDPDILVQETVHLALCHAIIQALKKE